MHEALCKSEARMRIAIEAAQLGIWDFDLLTGSIECSDLCKEFFGLSPDASVDYQTVMDRVHPDDRVHVQELIQHALESEEEGLCRTEYRLLCPDGTERWILGSGRAFFETIDGKRRAVRFSCTLQDITERKQMEEELKKSHSELELRVHQRTAELERADEAMRQSEERFYSFMAHIPLAAWIIDSRGRILYANPGLHSVLGVKANDLIGKMVEEGFEEDVAKACTAGNQFVLRERRALETVESVKTGVRPHRSIRTFLVIKFPMESTSGEILVGGLALDITDQMRAEDELKLNAAKLEQRNKELEDFAFISSHHVQEPLRKILTFSDKIRIRLKDVSDPEVREYINRMQKSVKRIQALVRDLLRYSRMSSETAVFEPVDLSALVQEALSCHEQSIKKAQAHVELSALPTIEAEKAQMRTLFSHLIENAVKFRAKKAPVIKIYSRSKSREDKEFVDIFVEDNGIGFDGKYLDRIFTPFQQLHGMSRYGGTGMGLALCRRIVELHGGSITAESRQGEGATFIVSLPVYQ